MKIKLHTEQWFDAAHHLNCYDGACANLHGHTYKLEMWVIGDENMRDVKTGILFDFGILKNIAKEYDHCGDLTELMGVNSTAENQALAIYRHLKSMRPELQFCVRLYEQVQPKESWAQVGDFDE
jgi:6-pyruvoyltetrahydropterin/6-carboxytetrahydropterin synthase